MKKKIVLALLGAASLAGCSGEDAGNVNNEQDNLMSLSRVVTFTPLESNYETKQVAYYDDGTFLGDTLFDTQGAILNRTVRAVAGSTETTTTYDASGEIMTLIAKTYDSSDRLIELNQSIGEGTYRFFIDYNADGSATASYEDSDTGQLIPYINYYSTADGLYTSSVYINDGDAAHMEYSGGLPSQVIVNPQDGNEYIMMAFSYYNVPVPANELKNVTQLNNAVLQQNQLNRLADLATMHLKSYNGLYLYEKEFNSLNYVTYQKISLANQPWTSESFFYYDE